MKDRHFFPLAQYLNQLGREKKLYVWQEKATVRWTHIKWAIFPLLVSSSAHMYIYDKKKFISAKDNFSVPGFHS